MDNVFGVLKDGERDERECTVQGKVLTARRLGSVLFISIDPSSFIYPLQSPKHEQMDQHEQHDNEQTQQQAANVKNSENNEMGKLEFEKGEVVELALMKEEFKGEIRTNSDGSTDIQPSLKDFARAISMGNTVEIKGQAERSSRGHLRVCCFWIKIVAKDRINNKSQIMSKEDRDFQGHVPLCLFFRRGQECTKPVCAYRHEFKDERERLNAINMQLRHKQILKVEKDPCDPHPVESKQHRNRRAELFIDWLSENFKELLSKLANPSFLDIAGGRGLVSLLLLNKGYDSVLVEPRDHKFNPKKMKQQNLTIKGQFTHMQCKLDAQFLESPEGQQAIERADIVIGMHPDEATEAIFDLALKYNKPFAVVPCCVFPNLFPRTNKHGLPVVTYFEFIDYLLDKDPEIKVGYLGFQGRTKILYKY